jgi:hypothetical protein
VLRLISGKKKLEHRYLLKTRTGTLALPKCGLVYGNSDEGGFYHPLHDDNAFRALLRNLDRLDSSERLGLVTHTWALACAGETSLARVLELARALGSERDPDVVAALEGPLHTLFERVAQGDPTLKAKLRAVLGSAFLPGLEQLGLTAHRPRGMSDADSVRRAELVSLLGTVAELPEVVERAARIGKRYLEQPNRVDPNLSGPALAIFARGVDREAHARLLERSLEGVTPGERRRFRMALADARDLRCIERTLALCLSPKIPAQDVALVLARLFENPAARKTAFDFVIDELARVKRRLPPMLASRLVESARALATDVPPRRVLSALTAAALPGTTQALARLRERFQLDEKLALRESELR